VLINEGVGSCERGNEPSSAISAFQQGLLLSGVAERTCALFSYYISIIICAINLIFHWCLPRNDRGCVQTHSW
jgi:hypothetical protein